MKNLLAKQNLTAEQLTIVNSEVDKKKKSKGLAYVIWWFTGLIGGHRFYLGDIGLGIAQLLTLGGFGIWWLIDAFLIGSTVEKKTEQLENDIIQNVKLMSKNK